MAAAIPSCAPFALGFGANPFPSPLLTVCPGFYVAIKNKVDVKQLLGWEGEQLPGRGAERARGADPALKSAPHLAPRRRLDETLAARKPVLTWSAPPTGAGQAGPTG